MKPRGLSWKKVGNPHYEADPEKFDQLLDIMCGHTCGFAKMLVNPERKSLMDWIIQRTPRLSDPDFRYSLGTRCYWVLNGMVDFPTCECPGYPPHKFGMRQNVIVTRGYPEHCCLSHSQQNPAVWKKKGDTCERHFGVRVISQSERGRQLTRRTKQERYGDPNYNNREQSVKTSRKKNGGKYRSDESEIQRVLTSIEKWGKKNYCNREKSAKAMQGRYGYSCAFAVPEFRERSLVTMLARYGTVHVTSSYVFDGLTFDSAPELAKYIWHRDREDDFEYHPAVVFKFEYSGEMHAYQPDFRVGTEIHEVKGDQFFREDGTMFCPYRRKEWSDETYGYVCGLYEAKRQCMLANGVRILRSADYQKYVDYVQWRYGKAYLKSFRSKSRRQAQLGK